MAGPIRANSVLGHHPAHLAAPAPQEPSDRIMEYRIIRQKKFLFDDSVLHASTSPGGSTRWTGWATARRRIVRGTSPTQQPRSEGPAMTERDIFLALLDLPDPTERSAFLTRTCA